MMRRFVTMLFVVGAVAGCALNAAAQSKTVKLDPAAEFTIAGTVSEVIGMAGAEGEVGLHIVVKTDKGFVAVRLGPAMFIGMSNFSFLADDHVEIVAIPISKDRKTVVARSITKADKTLTLRDEAGVPVWTPLSDGTDGCGVTHVAAVAGTEG